MPTKKRKDETRDDFIKRCMREIYDEFPDNSQRYAVCISYADKSDEKMKKQDLYVLTPRKAENRGQYLKRCSSNTKMKEQFKDLKERLGFCLSSFNEYYKYWTKIEEFAEVPANTALGTCIAKKKSQGLDYKEAYAQCASKVVVPNAPVNLGEDNLLVEPVEFEEGNMDVFGYMTRFFQLCPGAQATFMEITSDSMIDDETKGMVRSAAQVADNVFRIEKEVMEKGFSTELDVQQAELLVGDFKDIIVEIMEETGKTYDVEYMNRHIDLIKSAREYEMGLEDACWEGYEPYGLKPNAEGRMVPNCVPIKEEE